MVDQNPTRTDNTALRGVRDWLSQRAVADTLEIAQQTYSNTYAWFLEMKSGRIIHATAFFDTIEFNDLWSRVAPKPPG